MLLRLLICFLVSFTVCQSCKIDNTAPRLSSDSVKYTPIQPNLSNIDPTFQFLQFTSPNVGFIRGGRLLNSYAPILFSTQDGGQHWQTLRLDSITLGGLKSFYALNQYILWGTCIIKSGQDALIKSVDGGQSWQIINGQMPEIHALWFLSDTNGIGVGGSGIIHTTDGGRTWITSDTGQANFPNLYILQFITEKTGFAVGGVYTNDGGIGGGINNYGSLWRTDDGGQTWQSLKTSFPFIIASSFINSQTGYIVTVDQKLYLTNDGGQSWQIITDKFPGISGELAFIDKQQGFFAGTNNRQSGIYRTTDGGVTWALEYQVKTDPTKASINSLSFNVANRIGFATGRGGIIIKIQLN